MATRTAYTNTLETQLRQWDAQIAAWSAQADRATVAARIEYEYELDGLRSKRAVAHNTVRKLAGCSEEARQGLTDSAERTWKWMDKAMERAAARFG